MPGDPSDPRLLRLLAGALALSLLAIAFLLGRESVQLPASEHREEVAEQIPVVPRLEVPSPRALWLVGDPELLEGTRQEPDGTLVLSNTGPAAPAQNTPTGEPASSTENAAQALDRYFTKMDSIRSHAGVGDPNAFAMELIKGGMGGASAGFDQLIGDARAMTNEVKAITPPPGCESYHGAKLEALAESERLLEQMKTAITSYDIEALGSIAQQAANLQRKAGSLKALEQRLRAAAR